MIDLKDPSNSQVAEVNQIRNKAEKHEQGSIN